MAKSSKIKVMISSRCNDLFPLSAKGRRHFSEIRKQVKSEIEAFQLFGQRIYEVWINEDAIEDGSRSSWERCVEQARDCDVFIALYNGNAGWLGGSDGGTVGICHAEFTAAQSIAPGKVFVINIHEPNVKGAPNRPSDKLFQADINRLGRLDARDIKTDSDLVEKIKHIVADSTVKLVHRGVRDASRGTNYLGPALDWSRESYEGRSSKMRYVALNALRQGNYVAGPNQNVVARPIGGRPILFVVNSIPNSMSIPAARELVGQPHLSDHLLSNELSKVLGGPVHLVTCHKSVSKSHAVRMLGFPKATVVSGPFGIYVVDPVQSIQLVLISQCRDETSTRHGIQRFLAWLDETKQNSDLVKFAKRRKAIVAILAK